MLPKGSSTALAGESRELEESGSSLYFAFLLALLVVFMVLASQFESLVHPFTVLLAVPLAVTGALFTLKLAGATLNLYSQIGMILLIGLVTKNSILLVEYINQLKERGLDTVDGGARGGPHPAPADSHDVGRHDHGRDADRLRARRGLDQPPAAGLRHRGRRALLDAAHAVRGAGRVRDLRRAARAGRRPLSAPASGRSPPRRPSDRRRCCSRCRCRAAPAPQGPAPRVTLDQAIARATRLDPDYVRALGQVDNAEWGRRAALAVFILPSLTASLDATKYSTEFFNVGTGRNQHGAVIATFTAQLRAVQPRGSSPTSAAPGAELEGAEASELQQRFQAAL